MRRAISSASGPLVSGPLATIQMASSVRARDFFAAQLDQRLGRDGGVTSAANTSRSTVSAWPPGNARLLRGRSSSESRRRSSSFSSHGAVDSDSLFSELLHTSSARRSVWCAGVGRTGRISWSTHGKSAARDLPGGFRAGEAAADDVDGLAQS